MAESHRVLSLFLELAAIPSPPGEEREVAVRVVDYLRALGLEVEEDDAGNLLAPVAPSETSEATPIFLCAHLDTVPPEGPIEPVVEDGVVRNAAATILGADNKAAVAVMLEAARRLLGQDRPRGSLELLFTTREEVGLLGAKEFDSARLHARTGFVYDHGAPIGDVVVAAPYQRTIDAVFKGRAAHAGMHPDEGRSAIYAAAKAVGELRLGRIDAETTANVGRIAGGTARNIVPDRCTIAAEGRSRDERKLSDLCQEMLESLAFAAAAAECEVETRIEETYRGYRFRRDDTAVGLAFTALERAGFEPRAVEAGGGADANVFNAQGLACVNLANGMARIHSAEEHIAVADLEAMVDVTLALVDAARMLRRNG